MKNLSKTILTVFVIGVIGCAFFSPQAQAAPSITGTITMAGTATYDTGSLATAKAVLSWGPFPSNGVLVITASGSFTGLAGSTATMSPWTFNPSTATPSLWSDGGFHFDLASSTILTQNASTLSIGGFGTIFGPGFAPTFGSWNFTSNPPNLGGDTFVFSAGTAAVPDGGSAVALLGIGLAGIEGLRRKIGARKA